MNPEDYILDEADALARVDKRAPLSVTAWIYCAPFLARYIDRKGWTIRRAAVHFGRSKTYILACRKINTWPDVLRNRVVAKSADITVTDLLWLARQNGPPSELLERIDLHVSGRAKIPSRKLKPQFRQPSRPTSNQYKSADAQYITEQIRAHMKLGIDSLEFEDLDPTMLAEILRRLGLKR